MHRPRYVEPRPGTRDASLTLHITIFPFASPPSYHESKIVPFVAPVQRSTLPGVTRPQTHTDGCTQSARPRQISRSRLHSVTAKKILVTSGPSVNHITSHRHPSSNQSASAAGCHLSPVKLVPPSNQSHADHAACAACLPCTPSNQPRGRAACPPVSFYSRLAPLARTAHTHKCWHRCGKASRASTGCLDVTSSTSIFWS